MSELVAHGARQVVGRIDGPRVGGEVSGEQLFGQRLEIQPKGQTAKVVGEILHVRQQLDRRVVALQRTLQVAGLVPRNS